MEADRKPILYRVFHEWEDKGIKFFYIDILLASPVPYTNLYLLYIKERQGEPGWKGSSHKIYTREEIEREHSVYKFERIDRLTALTAYGMIVEE